MTTFSITIPRLPPAECSPNSRVHWREKGKAVAIAKDEAIAAVKAQEWSGPPVQSALIQVSWGVKDKRKRDTDNFVARTKPFMDGIVIAGVIADDSRFHVRYQYGWHEAERSETVITISEEA
jgi:Holliday junction resolvase RusA-like endonuclease